MKVISGQPVLGVLLCWECCCVCVGVLLSVLVVVPLCLCGVLLSVSGVLLCVCCERGVS